MKVKRPQFENRHDKVILLHDNARPHVTEVVKTYMEMLKWEVLPHIAPSDFHFFLSTTHGLSELHFDNFERTRRWIDSFIEFKDEEFFRRGIRALPGRWHKVEENDGQYFEYCHCNDTFILNHKNLQENATN